MSEMKNQQNQKPDTGIKWAIPFLLTLAVLTVVSFMIPLRPTQSQSEKRNLAEFPEFTLEALVSGDYFDDITLWFSDTFPGRETWLEVATMTSSFHGYSEITIQGDLPVPETVPEVPDVYIPPETTEPPVMEETQASSDETQPEETVPEETEWGGVDAAEVEIMFTEAAIQIGDAVYTAQGFSQVESNNYIEVVNKFYDAVAEQGIRVINACPPTAIGIMIEEEYLEQLRCVSQDKILNYIHSGLNENIVKVDTVSALIAHNDEYIYFRTDHHWTALGAYYAYEAVCEALDMEPAKLEDFETIDCGLFHGSLSGKARQSYKLTWDNVIAYVPPGEIIHSVYGGEGYGYERQIITDTSTWPENAKYSAFGTDYHMTHSYNPDLPEGKNVLVIKDSFGNCFAPFLTQNYQNVYAVDYRKFYNMPLTQFVEKYEIDDVIFAPYITATQAITGNNCLNSVCF